MCARIAIQHVALNVLNTPSSTNPNTIGAIVTWCPNPSLNLVLVSRYMNMCLWWVGMCNTPGKKSSEESSGNK